MSRIFSCQPRTKIIFLKTHKCASSTVQNILLREALRNDLNVVLPPEGNYVGKYVPFSPRAIRRTPWEKAGLRYDMYVLHGIWNGSAVRSVMNRQKVDPRGKGFYFTIVRDRIFIYQLYEMVVCNINAKQACRLKGCIA